MMNKKIVLAGSLLFTTAIILGAFGAHALKELLSAEKLQSFEVGVRYQFYVSMIIIGISFFSGSIYLLSIEEILQTNLGFLGPVTPIGGALMIVGWIQFIVRLMRVK